jgi:hypothetical protein
MAGPPTSDAAFALLARRAGFDLDAAHRAELYGAWLTLEALIERLRTPRPGDADEPATIFEVTRGGAP